MSGLDEIINIIDSQQKQAEDGIIKSAESKAGKIRADGDAKALKAYNEHKAKDTARAETEYKNMCSSIDSEMKRKILECKVELIDGIIEKTIERMKSLPDDVYFGMLARISEKYIHRGDAVMYLGSKDLERLPNDFAKKISDIAVKKGGTVKLSEKPADIDDGFVLEYGLISENCSFRAVAEAEKDGIRDIISGELFGVIE